MTKRLAVVVIRSDGQHSAGAHVNWVRPRVVVDVEYRQFTGRLRHPSLKGLAAVDPDLVRLPEIT